MNLCIHCKWSWGTDAEDMICRNPEVVGINPVDGKLNVFPCSVKRMDWILTPSPCGVEGLKFESKETMT